MPLGKRLSPYEAGQIDALLSEGLSQNKVASRLHRSHKAVQTYVKNRATYFDKHPNGSVQALTERDKRAAIRYISATGASVNEARRVLKLPVSRPTLYRAVASCRTLRYIKIKTKPRLKAEHIARRLQFAKEHMTWNVEWRSVVFSDEKKFNLDGPDGLHYYWHDLRKEERLLSRRVHGGASVMVWASFCFSGKSEIVFRECKGKADVYRKVLNDHLLPFIRRLGGGKWTFQQDGASVHTAADTIQWLRAHNLDPMSWPSLSPDLNPIENLWGALVRLVYDNGRRQFNTAEELRAAIQASWNSIGLDVLENLARSMPERMYEVIRLGGKSTKF